MSRILSAAKDIWMVLHMTRPLFVGFQLFAGHVKGSQPIKRKEKMH